MLAAGASSLTFRTFGTLSSVIGMLSPSLAANHAADSVEKKMSIVGRAFSSRSRASVCPAPPW